MQTAVIKRNIQLLVQRELKVVFFRLWIPVVIVCIILSQLGFISLRLPFLS